jgi:hypothetical protein
MENQNLPPDEQDIDAFSTPVQNFAFGGIANPVQRAMLRGSDKEYLGARQKELDAFEAQRLSYNDALTKYQNEVYNPYKAQTEAYNAAAQKYNDEIYNPYKTKYEAYEKAISDWNAGDRTTDYAGPEAPTLGSTFDMTAPKDPDAFTMKAPEVPFKVEDVQAYQQQAAERAREDAGNRSVAIDVVSDPDRFNFGSMSVSNRFMAKGGEVKSKEKSAKEMLGEMDGGYEPDDAAILKMAQEISSKGKLTHAQIMEAVDRVAAAGRGGDELLAYLSPASVEILKKMGGSGSINPATGLHEFKGGVLGKVVNAVKRVFGGRSAAPAAAAAAAAPAAAAPAATGPSAADLQKQLDDANASRTALQTKYDTDLSTFKTQAQKDQEAAIANALRADAESRAKMIAKPVIGTEQAPTTTPAVGPVGTAAQMATPAVRSMMQSSAPSASAIQSMQLATPAAAMLNTVSAARPLGQVNLGGQVSSPSMARQQQQQPGMMPTDRGPDNLGGGNIPSMGPSTPSYSNRGVGAVGDIGGINIQGPATPMFGNTRLGSATTSPNNPNNYFGISQPGQQGISPGTTAIGSPDMPMYGAMNTMNTLGQNKNLSPTMLGGQENAGVMTDRLGNRIYAPGMGPLFGPPGFAKGGLADVNEFNMADAEDEPINTDPAGSAQKLLADLTGPTKSVTEITESPNAKSIKRVSKKTSGGAGGTAKGMSMEYEALTSAKDLVPQLKDDGSARSQMEALALAYKLRAQQASDKSRGLMRNTLGAPTLEQPTLTKGRLTAKRFEKGGEAKKASAEVAKGTGDFSDDMFPEYQKGGVVNALKGTKAVDKSGKPVVAYRGEYGPDASLSTRGGSLTFGTKEAANLYATSPNNSASAVEAAKVFPSYLSIRKPFLTDPDDPFVDLGVLRKALGNKEFKRVVEKNVDYIERTGGYDELATAKGYMSALDAMKKDPKAFDKLYMEAYPVLDDPRAVKALQKRGYDGAIYGGSGATAMEAEYRVFSPSQAISPYGNKPMAPRSAGQRMGDLARSMDVSPTDALGFFGRAAGVVGSALTPSTLNEGEDAELARRRAMPPTIDRAEGSPIEGEESLDKYYAPKARPSTGRNRKEGPISQQLKSGEAYVNMAKGVTELPYDLAGAPVDLATMLMRPFGYSTEKPVMGSDWIKQQMTDAKIRPEPPANSTSKGFYTAGELLSNLTNPAAVSRKVGPVVEKGVKAGAKEVGRQLDRAIMDDAGPLSKFVPQSAKPLYAVRPTGSTMLSGPVGMQEDVSKVDQLLKSGLTNAKQAAGQNEGQALILQDFWNKKARNYFTRQFGTPDDPIATAISKKQIRGTALDEMFPEYLVDQIGVGKTRVNAEGQERFFPKYPRAMEDFTSRYDKATGIKGNLITTDPAAANPKYSNLLSDEGRLQALVAQTNEQDKLLAQGVRPELINTDVGAVTASAMEPGRVIGDGTDSAKALFDAYQEAGKFKQMDEPQKTSWINQVFGEGRRILGKNESEVGKNLLPENVKTAIDKGEPIYDVGYMRSPLTEVFNPTSINQYLASIPPREAANIRFEDAVKGAVKMKEKAAELENVVSRIKSGKPVADTVFSKGVSAPLLQIDKGPLEGYAWKRIEKREATVPEGAYVGHSVGGYETGGATYTQEKREGFNTGRWQVYTLRDNRNRPVNTIEVQMLDELTPVVMQVKGNGRATGNTAPEKYDGAVLQFLQDYLRPAAIKESDEYLTPLLQEYKNGINASFKMP